MKAYLIYKNETSGELKPEDIELTEEFEADLIMMRLIENRTGTSIITIIDNKNVKIPVYKYEKEGKIYSMFRLVEVRLA